LLALVSSYRENAAGVKARNLESVDLGHDLLDELLEPTAPFRGPAHDQVGKPELS
jgi:hypothetical protein